MTQESNVDDAVVPKLLIDRPSDFKFHAAYEIYSRAWDKTSSKEVKMKLNEIITSLSKGEIDYQSFYGKINRYRMTFNSERYRGGARARIQTLRKRDWRRIKAKNERNARHRRSARS